MTHTLSAPPRPAALLTRVLGRWTRRPPRRHTRPMLEPMEGRLLLTTLTNADLQGDAYIGGIHRAGTIVFDGQSNQFGIGSVAGSLLEDGNVVRPFTDGIYNVSSWVFSIHSLDLGPGSTTDEGYLGYLSNTADLAVMTPPVFPTTYEGDSDFALLVRNTLLNNSNANLSGPWRVSGLETVGTVVFDGQGSLTAGNIFGRNNLTSQIVGGTYNVSPNGFVTLTAETNNSLEPLSTYSGQLNSSRDVLVLNDPQVYGSFQSDMDLNVLVRVGGVYGPQDAVGLWNFVSPFGHGTVAVSNLGNELFTAGTFTGLNGETENLITSFDIASNGNVIVAVSSESLGTLQFAGAMNASRSFIAANTPTNDTPPSAEVPNGMPGNTPIYMTRFRFDDGITGPILDGSFGLITSNGLPIEQVQARPGDPLAIPLSLLNSGDETISSNIPLNFFLSSDIFLDETDTLLYNTVEENVTLEPASSRTFNFNTAVPQNTADGVYFILVQIDPQNISGGSRSNNIVFSSQPLLVSSENPQPEADLSAVFGTITLTGVPIDQASILPGDTLAVPLTLVNAGDLTLTGNIKVNLFLSTDASLSENDLLISGKTINNFLLNPGQTSARTFDAALPANLNAGTYFILAQVDPLNATGGGGADNVFLASQQANVQFKVGNVPGRGNVTITIPIPGGATANFKLTGGGSADLTPIGDGSYSITFLDTLPNSSLTITTSKGSDGTIQPIFLRDINIGLPDTPQGGQPLRSAANTAGGAAADTSALGKLIAKTARLLGNLNAPNGIGEITLDQIGSGAAINIGGGDNPNAPVTLNFNLVEDAVLTSARPIKALTVTRWSRNGNNPSTITAPSIGTLTVKGNSKFGVAGDFAADLFLNDNGPKTLGSAKISGSLNNANWQVVGTVGALAVTGDINGLNATISNSLKTLKAANLVNATLAVGGDAGSIAANNWLAGALNASTAKALALRGNMGANLNLTGNPAAKSTLPAIRITGAITGGQWTLGGAVGSIAALATDTSWTLNSGVTPLDLGSFTLKSDMGGTVNINSLGKAAIGGDITAGATLILNRAFNPATPKTLSLASLAVKGDIQTLTLRSLGGIGAVTARAITDSAIYAGLPLDFNGLPTDLGEFIAPATPLNSIRSTAFGRSQFAAGVIGSLALGVVNTDNNGEPTGIAADSIGKLTATVNGAAAVLPADGEATTVGDFTVRLLAGSVSSITSLIPWPQSVQWVEGGFNIGLDNRIVISNNALSPLGNLLSNEILAITGKQLTVTSGEPLPGDIVLQFDDTLVGEHHAISVTDSALVRGGNYNAIALGTVTLLQSLAASAGQWGLPGMIVEDFPDSSFRGTMIDVAQTRVSLNTLKDIVTLARHYKISTLQLHLSDHGAMVFPIESVPGLLGNNQAGPGVDSGDIPVTYTREQLQDLIDFAKVRGVTIIPELEVPGHARLLTVQRPDLFDTGIAANNGGIINIANPEAVAAVKDMITEIAGFFDSSPYFHFGADEISLTGITRGVSAQWDTKMDELTLAMREQGLLGPEDVINDPAEIYRDFLNDIAAHVRSLGKTPMIWEGFRPTGVVPVTQDLIVMSFEQTYHAPDKLAEAGYSIINASWTPLFTSLMQTSFANFPSGFRASTLEQVYNWNKHEFDVFPLNVRPHTKITLSAELGEQIVGSSFQTWRTSDTVILPSQRSRLAAMAENIWNPEAATGYDNFIQRLATTNARLTPLLSLKSV